MAYGVGMREVPLRPSLHVLVCTNRREPGDPLGPGCGDAGERVYDAFKGEVDRTGAHRTHWVARTRCLGVCPKRGATVIVHPGAHVLADVEPADVSSVLIAAEERTTRGT